MPFLRVLLLVVMAATGAGAPRDFKAMERRRKRAAQLFGQGKSQAEVVRELEVSRQSVSRWHADWVAGGPAALRAAGRAGRLPQLDQADLKRVERRLQKGPLENGYPADMWTIQRVAEVIESETGVAYHPGHVWRILGQMGWSRQRPARRAVERDDEAIANWVKQDWPRVKKTPDAARPGSASKTRAGFSLLPSVRATWAPERPDPGPAPPLQLEAPLDVGRRRLCPRRLRRLARVQHAPRCLQRCDAHRVPRATCMTTSEGTKSP